MAAPTLNGEVAHGNGNNPGAGSVTIALTADVTGNLLVLGLSYVLMTVSTITDSRGNSWAIAQTASGATIRSSIIVGRMDYKLKAGDTITLTTSGTGDYAYSILDYSNANLTTTSVDVKTGTTGSSTSPSSGATGATTVADEIVIGLTSWLSGSTADYSSAGAGYVQRGTIEGVAASIANALEDKTVSATGAQTSTATLSPSRSWAQVVVCIRGSVRWYVDYNKADNTGAGTSWATAKKDISALTVKSGDEIWMAKSTDPAALTGTMTFTDNSTSVATSADLSATLAAKDIIGPYTGSNFMTDPWAEVSSVTASTITLAAAYVGTTRTTVTGYRFNGFDAGSPATSSTATWSAPGGGNLASPIRITGGYNTSNDTRDGMTMMRVSSATKNGIPSLSGSFYTISYFASARHNVAFQATSGRMDMSNCFFVGWSGNGVTWSSTNGNTSVCDNVTMANGSTSQYFAAQHGCVIKNSLICGNTSATGVKAQTGAGFVLVDSCTLLRFNIGVNGDYYTFVRNCTIRNGNSGYRNANYGPGYVSNCTFSGNATADIVPAAAADCQIFCFNCSFGSTTTFTAGLGGGMVYSDRHNQTAGAYRNFDSTRGTRLSNTADARTGTCYELQPNITVRDPAGAILMNYTAPIPVDDSGALRTVTIYVKTSSTWNGHTLRVGIRRHFQWIAGQMVDFTGFLGTAAVMPGTTWTQYTFTYTMSEKGAIDVCVECDGTAGSVYIDDVAFI